MFPSVPCKVGVVLVLIANALASRWSREGRSEDPDPSRIIFRDDDAQANHLLALAGDRSNRSLQTPPIDFMKNLSKLEVTDLLLNYVDYGNSGDDGQGRVFLSDRFADDLERNSALKPKSAPCIPELKTVELMVSDDPTEMYIPQCTRIERCGGCCQHRLLSCQAQQLELVNFQVIRVRYTGGKKLKFDGKEVVTIERHTKCKCDCKIKAEDCNRLQEYRSNECRCACANHDEQKKCEKDYDRKRWDHDACSCRCQQVEPCSTGDYFDHNECRCQRMPLRRRYAYYELDKLNNN